MNTLFQTTNGIQLAYSEVGTGAPLILLHGLTANRYNFGGLLKAGLGASPDQARRVLALDLRGRGWSDKPSANYRMADHAQDVLGFMDAQGIEHADFVGHSFGGLLSFHLAAFHPERVGKIVVIDAGLQATDSAVLEKIRPSLERLGKALPSWEVFLSAIKQAYYYADGFWDADLEAFYRADVEDLPDGQVRSRTYADGIRQAIEDIISTDWHALLARVTCPALLINAPAPFPNGAEPILGEASARETAARLAQGRYLAVGGNHLTMVFGQYAPQVVSAIHDFLA